MATHTHSPIAQVPGTYAGCVSANCNPMAHNGARYIQTCACGQTRHVNANGAHLEEALWQGRAGEPGGLRGLDSWMVAYEGNLRAAVRNFPSEYSYTSADVPAVLPKMRAAYATPNGWASDGRAIKATARQLGIKATRAAINAYLKSGGLAPSESERIAAGAAQGVPPCLASMGCLCAGHARGNPASVACDTSEGG